MQIRETLLKEYASADEERRLSMFLTHRYLRREFTFIDAGEWRKTEVAAGLAEPAARPKTALQRAAWCCWGWLGYCRPDR
jgi:hypothetical protein